MSKTHIWNDFSAGWCPSDDPVNGRKNSLQKMDNVCLDKNNALTLVGGTNVIRSHATARHSLFSITIGNTFYGYTGGVNGNVTRNGTSIATGGSTTRAAFSTAFNYVLISSGAKRIKDTGTTIYNLGIAPAATSPNISGTSFYTVAADYGGLSTDYYHYNYSASTTSTVTNAYTYNTFHAGDLGGFIQNNAGTYPIDLSTLTAGANTLTAQDNDQFLFACSVDVGQISVISSIQIQILLEAPTTPGAQVSNYYEYTYDISDNESSTTDIQFTNSGVTRADFTKVGSSSASWSTVYGMRVTYTFAEAITATTVLTADGAMWFRGGIIPKGATIEYMQVSVRNDGSYVGKSTLSPIVTDTAYTVPLTYTVTAIDPTIADAQANEVWIFRRGSNLGQWYRIKKLTTAYTTPFLDNMTDTDAQTLGITYNSALTSILDITDTILEIIGPVEGRWFYFTDKFMYPSDINDPDLVNTNLGVRTVGGNFEQFMWAKKIAEGVILIGTSNEIYMLTGTFATLTDGTVDIYYRPLGVAFPPIAIDAVAYNGSVFYMANDGWRAVSPSSAVSATSVSLVSPNTDRLYRGITCFGYTAPVIKVNPGTTRFPVTIGKNKLWCGMTGTGRIEVYDFDRKYWYTINYGLGDVGAFATMQEGGVVGAFITDKTSREIDYTANFLIDGTTKQTVYIQSAMFQGDSPRNRKDLYTLKARIITAGDNLTAALIADDSVSWNIGNFTYTGGIPSEVILDVASKKAISKYWQYYLTGTFSTLTISDISLDYDDRPAPLTFLRIYNNNYGSAAKKRIRVLPIVIDTISTNVTATPYVDNVATTALTINNFGKNTYNCQISSDAFGIDYGMTLSGGPFEFWGQLNPEVVQVLPIAKRFDQVGPEELFRYGRIKQMEIRVLPYSGTLGSTSSLPYTMYFSDNNIYTGSITVNNAIECSYFVGLPKGIAGNIVRIEIGPTTWDFHRFYVRLQVMKSGRDTELEWVTLGANATTGGE